jgi:hypothetical protein
MVRQTTLTHNALFPLVSERLQTERSVDSPYKIPKSRQDASTECVSEYDLVHKTQLPFRDTGFVLA